MVREEEDFFGQTTVFLLRFMGVVFGRFSFGGLFNWEGYSFLLLTLLILPNWLRGDAFPPPLRGGGVGVFFEEALRPFPLRGWQIFLRSRPSKPRGKLRPYIGCRVGAYPIFSWPRPAPFSNQGVQ